MTTPAALRTSFLVFAAFVLTSGTALAENSANLVIRNAATGAQIGTWTSPSVPGGANVTTSLAAIFTATGVDPATAGIMIDSDHLAESLRLELTATSAQSGLVADQTVACGL